MNGSHQTKYRPPDRSKNNQRNQKSISNSEKKYHIKQQNESRKYVIEEDGSVKRSPSMNTPPSLRTVGLVMMIAKRMWKSAASPAENTKLTGDQQPYPKYIASKPTVISWLASCVIAFTLAFTYLYGVLCAARQSVIWEFILIFVLPAIGYVFLYDPKSDPVAHTRQQELILYETTFLILTCLSKASIQNFNSYGDKSLNMMFVVFFCFQTRGFYKMEIGMKQWWGFLRSTTLFWSIFVQRYSITENMEDPECHREAVWIHNRIDSQGRFLIWGQDAPTMVIVNYFWWLLGVLFVDYYEFLPWSMLHSFHMASFFLSASSGEFWHARLLSACHLFILDAVAYFKHGATLGSSEFARMPDSFVKLASKYWVPFFNILSTIGCLSCVIVTLACGQDTLYCVDFPRSLWPMI